jgi:hypothetical protein
MRGLQVPNYRKHATGSSGTNSAFRAGGEDNPCVFIEIQKLILIIFIVNSTHIKCVVYPTAYVTFSDLITHARAFDAIGDCTGSLEFTLMYNTKAKPKYGAFKQAIFGYVDRPALWNSTSVAIKQCFYASPSTGTRVLYDKHSQLIKLTAELN